MLTGRYGLIEFRAEDKHAGDEKVAQGESGTLEPETWNLKPGSETRVRTRRRRVPTKLETWSLRPVEAALGAFRPDIVHLQYQTGAYGMHPAVLLLPARLRRLRRDIPVLVTAHDLRLPYLFPRADLLRGWLTGRLLDDAGAVIVTNQDDAGRLAGLAPPSRELYSPRRPLNAQPIIIPIGSNIQPAPPAAYDRTAQRAATGAGPESVQIAYFGLLSRTKGVLELLQALAGTAAALSAADRRRLGAAAGRPALCCRRQRRHRGARHRGARNDHRPAFRAGRFRAFAGMRYRRATLCRRRFVPPRKPAGSAGSWPAGDHHTAARAARPTATGRCPCAAAASRGCRGAARCYRAAGRRWSATQNIVRRRARACRRVCLACDRRSSRKRVSCCAEFPALKRRARTRSLCGRFVSWRMALAWRTRRQYSCIHARESY